MTQASSWQWGPLGQQLIARKKRDNALRIRYDKLGGNRILQNHFKLKRCRDEPQSVMVLHEEEDTSVDYENLKGLSPECWNKGGRGRGTIPQHTLQP